MTDFEVEVSGSMSPQENDISKSFTMFQIPIPRTLSAPVVKDWIQTRQQNIRPWSTFINTTYFRHPASLPRLTKRILSNIEYFKSNYLFVYSGLVVYCLLTSPLLLLAVAASAGACYILTLRDKEGRKLRLLGKEVPLGQQYALVALSSLPIFYWVGAGAALFWVLGASFLIIGLHASFYNVEALLASQEERFIMEEV